MVSQQQHLLILHNSTVRMSTFADTQAATVPGYAGERLARPFSLSNLHDNSIDCFFFSPSPSLSAETAVMLSPATGRYATLPLEKMHREKPPPPYPGAGHILANGYPPASGLMNNSNGTAHVAGHHVIVTDSGTNGIIPQVLYYTAK